MYNFYLSFSSLYSNFSWFLKYFNYGLEKSIHIFALLAPFRTILFRTSVQSLISASAVGHLNYTTIILYGQEKIPAQKRSNF